RVAAAARAERPQSASGSDRASGAESDSGRAWPPAVRLAQVTAAARAERPQFAPGSGPASAVAPDSDWGWRVAARSVRLLAVRAWRVPGSSPELDSALDPRPRTGPARR